MGHFYLNNQNPLVSIIVPIYNTFPYVLEALNSVVNQTYKNIEIILVDDGSTDGSEEVCDLFARTDDRIRVVHQSNKGLSNARNVGLELMNGDFVSFLDSDDAYRRDYVEIMLAAMIREKTDIVVCHYSIHITDQALDACEISSGYPKTTQGLYDRKKMLNALVDGELDHHVWNKMYRSILWESIRFPDGHAFEDEDTTYRIIDCCHHILVIDDTLYLYRKRAGSITTNTRPKIKDDRILAWNHLISFIENNTPNVFSEVQLQRCYQFVLEQMIINTVRCSRRKYNVDNYGINHYREKIIDTGSKVDIKKCTFNIQFLYYIIKFCPMSLMILSPLYYFTRRLFDKVKCFSYI